MTHPLASLRSHGPFAWGFHWASSRWAFNMLSPDADETPEPGKEYPDARYSKLAERAKLGPALQAAIDARRSCRTFSADPVAAAALSSILHNSLGVKGTTLTGNLEIGLRPCPSRAVFIRWKPIRSPGGSKVSIRASTIITAAPMRLAAFAKEFRPFHSRPTCS